jgi:hypothetical protein
MENFRMQKNKLAVLMTKDHHVREVQLYVHKLFSKLAVL